MTILGGGGRIPVIWSIGIGDLERSQLFLAARLHGIADASRQQFSEPLFRCLPTGGGHVGITVHNEQLMNR
jgi:hypothetical protein